jgi:hypothetical protein
VNHRSGPNTCAAAEPAANTIANATAAPTMLEAIDDGFMARPLCRAAYGFLP